MKVLLADNSQAVTERLLTMMQEIPHLELLPPTRQADSTLESIRANDPQVLIIDIRILGAKEMGLLQTIRQEKPKIILIVFTNLVSPQYQRQVKALGADIFVDKSKEFVHLFQLVRELARCSFVANGQHDIVHNQLAPSTLRVGLQLCLFMCAVGSRIACM